MIPERIIFVSRGIAVCVSETRDVFAHCHIVHSITQSSLLHIADCESLIRKMLVLDPSKRYSVEHIKRHRWMVAEAPRLLPSTGGEQHGAEPNEQILRLMQSLGIDAVKTREVSCHLVF